DGGAVAERCARCGPLRLLLAGLRVLGVVRRGVGVDALLAGERLGLLRLLLLGLLCLGLLLCVLGLGGGLLLGLCLRLCLGRLLGLSLLLVVRGLLLALLRVGLL